VRLASERKIFFFLALFWCVNINFLRS
jgi:hypothetical protein